MPRVREGAIPRGLTRNLYRFPITLYRIGLGRLLGRRFLLLEHVGRNSGLPRHAVLEVIRRDAGTGTWYVSSGFGEASDWYRNLVATPRARVESAGETRDVVARVLPKEEAEHEILEYARHYPRSVRAVSRLMGWELDGSDDDLRAFAGELRIVALGSVTDAGSESVAPTSSSPIS